MSSGPGPWVERWLSAPRFGIYLTAAGGDRATALDLYEWNAQVSAAFQHDLAHLEVGLRNGYDATLVTGTPTGARHWTLDPYRSFPVDMRTARNGVRIDNNRIPREQLDRAVREAGGPSAPAGKVIAELTFGFWRYLSTRSHHTRLWVPHLHKAFAAGTARPDVDLPVGRLHKLRNRIAHHEPLLRENLLDRHDDVLTVAGLLSADLRTHLAVTTRLPSTVATKP